MKSVIEHVCPGCEQVLGRTRHTRATVGRPFDECPRCHVFVSRAPYNEWALMSSADKAGILGLQGCVALSLGLAPAAIAGVVGLLARRELDTLTLLIVAGIGLLVALTSWMARLTSTLRRSRRRMTDPMFQARLVQFAIQDERARAALAGTAQQREPV